MKKYSLMMALLLGVSALNQVSAVTLPEANEEVEKVPQPHQVASVDVETELSEQEKKNAALRQKLEERKAQKAARAAQKAEEETRKLKEAQEEQARLEAELAALSDSESEEVAVTLTPKAKIEPVEEEAENAVNARPTYGFSEKVVEFCDKHFGGPKNPRGDVLESLKWVLDYTNLKESQINTSVEWVVDGYTGVITIPFTRDYRGKTFHCVKLYASEMTRTDEKNSNLIHVQWKFGYNLESEATLHPEHDYKTPGGKTPPAPKNDTTLGSVLKNFGF